MQKRATRQVPAMKGLTYEERLKKLNLFTLRYRRLRGDMIKVYKILTKKYDHEAAPTLQKAVFEQTRGHSLKLGVRRANGGHILRQQFFTLRVVKPWNSLPESVVNATTLAQFKQKLDTFWSDNPLKFNSKDRDE